MHDNDPQSSVPPEVTVATAGTDEVPALPANLLAPGGAAAAALVDPEMLVQGLRYLQKRIPDLIQLSLAEQRSMARVAYLDRDFVDRGVSAGDAWHVTQAVTGQTGEEIREERDATVRWDEVERELLALAKGISHANLQRKHRLGDAILAIYSALGRHLNRSPATPAHAYMRPYYDEMKRAYLRATRKKPRKTAKADEPKTPKD